MKKSINQWNSTVYDQKLAYVANFGKDVVTLLDPQSNESILDIGCGTGDLTNDLQKSGAHVLGMDNSENMLARARLKYPKLHFIKSDVTTFQMDKKFDAVFSNAALHWVKEPEQAALSIYHALKQGGRFVAEFGGHGNVGIVINGILEVLREYNIDGKERTPWYFPRIGEYCSLLENIGFRTTFATHFDRPTTLSDGEEGLHHWLESFADDFFPEFGKSERNIVYEKVKQKVKSHLFHNGQWELDYKRLRIVAIKEAK